MNAGWRFALVLGAVLLVVGLIVGGGDDGGEPLDPTATGPDGAKALVVFLDGLGSVEVERGVPGPEVDTAVLLRDRLDDDRRAGLVDWVARGGTLVVADPASPFTPVAVETPPFEAGLPERGLDAGACDIDALADVEEVDPGAGLAYEVPEGATSCFGDGEEAFVVAADHGDGTVVAVGGPEPFLNRSLGSNDDAVLAGDLLAPEDGSRVAFVTGTTPGAGEQTLLDLIPWRVEQAILMLGIAFLVSVGFRARRAGRPIDEPVPTPIAGSELVAAVGRLQQQARAPEEAAAVLRADLRRTLTRRLGLAPDAPVDVLAEAVTGLGADPERVRAALSDDRVPADDLALISLAQEIDELRLEVLHDDHR
jgi:Domain of unknown function (DUF4350)